MNNVLLLDIGNTLLKLALTNDGINFNSISIDTRKLLKSKLSINKIENFLIQNASNFNKDIAIISSVVPNLNIFLVKLLKKHVKNIVFINDAKSPTKSGVDKKITGGDLIAKFEYAIDSTVGISLFIDIGTALVLQSINTSTLSKNYVISLGLSSMYRALHDYTGLLPNVKPSKEIVLFNAANTEECIKKGVYWSYISIVNGLVERALQELKGVDNIFITGGLAYLILDDLNFKYNYDPNLVLKGLWCLFKNM